VFTGIVQDLGRIQTLEQRAGDVRMVIQLDRMDPAGIRIGDSICVQGCCLTATEIVDRTFAADVSVETLSLTTLGGFRTGTIVNLEPSLKAGDALGGHLVSGHVDGVATIKSISGDARSQRLKIAVPAELARYIARKGSVAVDGVATIKSISGDARSQRLKIAVPAELARYIARKGSVAVDGVSLTVNEVEGSEFGVNIIPHTQEVTTLGRLVVGARVNLEIDQIARYVERLLLESSTIL
jgi:riboflavin synthase